MIIGKIGDMKRILLGVLILGLGVNQVKGYGAYLKEVAYGEELSFTWYVPSRANLVIVTQADQVKASYMDDGDGKVITALQKQDVEAANLAVFYSDSFGLSSRIPVFFSQDMLPTLMPPTIYSINNINGEYGSLGFIGSSFPNSEVYIEIELYTNEKIVLKTLANQVGEWQVMAPKLSPGEYQAKAYAVFNSLQSVESQEMKVLVLAPADRLIQDFGSGTRRSVEKVIEVMPGPFKEVVKTVDATSDISSKYIMPIILSVFTLAQTGILLQNILYLIFQALLAIGQMIGLVKSKEKTGLVYDSVSRKPLGRVIVRLYNADTHRLVETDVTSASGSFSFLPPEGFYYLRAMKPGYLFPSRLIESKRDGQYGSIYLGTEIQVSAGKPLVQVAIPLDPEEFIETRWMKVARFTKKWFEPANQWLLLVGFFLSLLAYTRQPNRTNMLVLGFYLGGSIYFWSQGQKFRREYGVVVNSHGKPMSGVELNLIDVEYNRLVSRRVTDVRGRYQFMAPPGKYQIKMVTTDLEMATKVVGMYQGQEIAISGERGQVKHIGPKIMVKKGK